MAQFNNVGGKIVPVTKGVALPGRCFSLLVGQAGTLNVTDATGTARTDVPVVAGYNPLAVESVDAGGSADDIWALYEAY